MSDIFNENLNGSQPEAEQEKPFARRRRTERHRDAYDEAAPSAAPVTDAPTTQIPPVTPAAETTVNTPVKPVAPFAQRPAASQPSYARPAAPVKQETTAVPAADKKAEQPAEAAPRFQTRHNPATPSQGVPRPAVLSGQQPVRQRTVNTHLTDTVRRPVNAEGYSPIAPLGTNRPQKQTLSSAPRARRPEPQDLEYRARPVENDDYVDIPEAEEKKSRGKGLVIAVIIVLILAALVLGLMLIPDDDAGFLGDVKRAVTAPIQSLLGKDDDAAATGTVKAEGLMSNITKQTAPYEINFTMETSSNVTSVRIVDAESTPLNTRIDNSFVTADGDKYWVFTVTLENEYEGLVRAQIAVGETWTDTDQTQSISFDTTAAPEISALPDTTKEAAGTDAPVSAPATLTADSNPEPTVSAAMTEIPTTPTPAPVQETAVPEPTDEPLPEATPTPTLAVTATPTLVPTATPEVLTPEPTEEPTPEPTPEPTAEPTPEPVVTPKLEAAAADSADPALISTQVIYEGTKKVASYEREKPLNMPAAEEYLTKDYGVTTFRSSAFRQNAASGHVENPTSMSVLWTVEGGSVETKSRTFYGFGWPGQPVIVQWTKDIRQSMDLAEERKNQSAMKEVIVAGQDGTIYFLDLKDGTATREAIAFGYPMRGTPALHPLGYPLMTVGQYSRFLPNKSGDIGLYYYNLQNKKMIRLIDGLDGKADRHYNDIGAFDTSALIDRNSDTLVAIGTNGLLYTETLDMDLYIKADGSISELEFNTPEQVVLMSHTKGQDESKAAVESSLAMYGSYAFYADLGGVLRCVDTTTMTTMWAVETGDAVKAAIALDLDEESGTLWLYTANTITNRSKSPADVTVRRYNAMTGEQDWAFAVNSQKKTGKKDSYGKDITAGAMASPVVGRNDLNGLVYFTLSSLSKTGNGAVTGDDSKTLPAAVIALDKATGEVVWAKAMDAYCYSSPVAVYNEDGRGWLIQACSNGTLYLMDGLSGETIGTLQLGGVIEASPAVFNDVLVIGTTGKGTSQIYGVKLQ